MFYLFMFIVKVYTFALTLSSIKLKNRKSVHRVRLGMICHTYFKIYQKNKSGSDLFKIARPYLSSCYVVILKY